MPNILNDITAKDEQEADDIVEEVKMEAKAEKEGTHRINVRYEAFSHSASAIASLYFPRFRGSFVLPLQKTGRKDPKKCRKKKLQKSKKS